MCIVEPLLLIWLVKFSYFMNAIKEQHIPTVLLPDMCGMLLVANCLRCAVVWGSDCISFS
jgi:hypothetical protein